MPYHVAYTRTEHSDLGWTLSDLPMVWCNDTVGPYGDLWKRLDFVFCFRSEADAMLFKLKFG